MINEDCNDMNTILTSLSAEEREELDHAVEERGYSYDSIENAFLYLGDNEKEEFSCAIKVFSNALTQDEKNEALETIVKTIE